MLLAAHADRLWAANLSYDFNNSLQGWTNLYTSPTTPNSFQPFQNNPSDGNAPFNSLGSWQATVNVSSFQAPYDQQSPHNDLVLVSPTFRFQAGAGISADLAGGGSAASPPTVGGLLSSLDGQAAPDTGNSNAFLGLSLVDATTGLVIASLVRTDHGLGDGSNLYQTETLSTAQLSALGVLGTGHQYELAFIDAAQGNWGWNSLANVSLTNVSPTPEPASFVLAGLARSACSWLLASQPPTMRLNITPLTDLG